MEPDPRVAGTLAAHEHALVILLASQLYKYDDDLLRRALDGLVNIRPVEKEVDPARLTETMRLIRYITTESLERIADRVLTHVRQLQSEG